MALSSDIKIVRYGTPIGHEPLNKLIVSGQTIYRGSFAGMGAGVGKLKNMASPAATDVILGMVECAGPGAADVSPGLVGDGTLSAQIATGSFLVASGTGADTLDVTTNGTVVYCINENTVGKTSGSSTRPVAGVQLACNADDPSIPAGFVAIKVGTPNSPLGGP